MIFNLRQIACVATLASLLSGCASIKLPDMDFIRFPEFKEAAENIPDYPNVADAPERPKGLRSDQNWDLAAKNILEKQDSFTTPDLNAPKSDIELLHEIQRLQDEVDAYKKDDPQ